MIIQCKSGVQVVIGECPWVPGVYLSIGNIKGSSGGVIDPAAVDQVILELQRIRADLDDRTAEKETKKSAA